MSGAQPEKKRGRNGKAVCALLLATSVFALLRPAQPYAQVTELRGEVSESAILEDQQRKTRQLSLANAQDQTAQAGATTQSTAPTPTYQPASPGAVQDDDTAPATGSIFDPPDATDDPFADTPAPIPPRRPSSATQGAADRDEAAETQAAETQAATATTVTTDGEDSAATDQDPVNSRAVTIDSADRQLDPGAERVEAIEGRDRRAEDDPFAATGIKLGSFVIRPTLEQGLRASSNADSSSEGKPALLSETALRFNAISDWRENSAVIDGYGIFLKTISGDEVEEARGAVDGTLNIDLDNDLRAIANLGYEAAPESASSPVVIEGTVEQPVRQSINSSLAVEKDAGKMRFALTGAVEHDIYGDARLSTGGTLSQKDRDSTLYTATLRTGYEISPAITPFTEVEIGRRVYDLRVDTNGFERSSTGFGIRAGAELDLGEKLAGEFSAGWLREAIDDDRLPAISGATVNADLRWSPERGTTIGLIGQTTVEGTTTANESGDILYSGLLTGEREIRANLIGNAAFGVGWRDYIGSDGHDLTLSAEAGLTWWLNRYAGLTTRARTEKQISNLEGRDYTAHSIFVGVTLQP
ncbi:outer membrane beta-barrel protein [Mesorhizobium ventifaucium]|uniref:Outer membrane protein/protective antigen OMA87 n=1 Tax=Mesorhizobium ventifaucium TaxID=666020 RepID=A0ABM9DWJ5_9HYPH|nr:outer membrane beta-barrel protein [Mesorhizobium ventifaucium]CAH2401126.1 Outer membrane protein/protective antigen OMA87 [Mesorhizobium ventifaucium]